MIGDGSQSSAWSDFETDLSALCRQAATFPPWVATSVDALPTVNAAGTSGPFVPTRTGVGRNNPSPTSNAVRINIPLEGIYCLAVVLGLVWIL